MTTEATDQPDASDPSPFRVAVQSVIETAGQLATTFNACAQLTALTPEAMTAILADSQRCQALLVIDGYQFQAPMACLSDNRLDVMAVDVLEAMRSQIAAELDTVIVEHAEKAAALAAIVMEARQADTVNFVADEAGIPVDQLP